MLDHHYGYGRGTEDGLRRRRHVLKLFGISGLTVVIFIISLAGVVRELASPQPSRGEANCAAGNETFGIDQVLHRALPTDASQARSTSAVLLDREAAQPRTSSPSISADLEGKKTKAPDVLNVTDKRAPAGVSMPTTPEEPASFAGHAPPLTFKQGYARRHAGQSGKGTGQSAAAAGQAGAEATEPTKKPAKSMRKKHPSLAGAPAGQVYTLPDGRRVVVRQGVRADAAGSRFTLGAFSGAGLFNQQEAFQSIGISPAPGAVPRADDRRRRAAPQPQHPRFGSPF